MTAAQKGAASRLGHFQRGNMRRACRITAESGSAREPAEEMSSFAMGVERAGR